VRAGGVNQQQPMLVDAPALGAPQCLEEARLLLHQRGRARHLGRAESAERHLLAVDLLSSVCSSGSRFGCRMRCEHDAQK
jgi:hypothetical protein